MKCFLVTVMTLGSLVWVGGNASVEAAPAADSTDAPPFVENSHLLHRDMKSGLRNLLEISEEEMKQYKDQDLTFKQMIEKAGKDPVEVKKQLKAQLEKNFDQLIKDGWITEKTKDYSLQQFDQEFDEMLEKKPSDYHDKKPEVKRGF
ncbi:hypothetical protein [Pontibacillus halophilus]|uniref:hypothetical protein n=1 Tax=Pontibacillus halophilus TaxID=516704 RepID=UPI001B7FC789|nr:hypothetical protein [Pontibacillus halophilus]